MVHVYTLPGFKYNMLGSLLSVSQYLQGHVSSHPITIVFYVQRHSFMSHTGTRNFLVTDWHLIVYVCIATAVWTASHRCRKYWVCTSTCMFDTTSGSIIMMHLTEEISSSQHSLPPCKLYHCNCGPVLCTHTSIRPLPSMLPQC